VFFGRSGNKVTEYESGRYYSNCIYMFGVQWFLASMCFVSVADSIAKFEGGTNAWVVMTRVLSAVVLH